MKRDLAGVDEVTLIKLRVALRETVEFLHAAAQAEIGRLGGGVDAQLAVSSVLYELAVNLNMQAMGREREQSVEALRTLGLERGL